METIRIIKRKDNKYHIEVKEYKFLIFPIWKKLTYLTDSNKVEDIMLFETKQEAKEFLNYFLDLNN